MRAIRIKNQAYFLKDFSANNKMGTQRPKAKEFAIIAEMFRYI
jgi:hypothetical protein